MRRRKRLKEKGLIPEWNPSLDVLKSLIIGAALSTAGIWGSIKLLPDKEVKEVKEERVDIGGGISVAPPTPAPAPVIITPQPDPAAGIDPGPDFPVPSNTPVVEGITMPDGSIFVPSPHPSEGKGEKGKGKGKGKPVFED